MDGTNKKEQTTTHKIGIYLWIWGLLFVLSAFSYAVDWYQLQGMLRWSLILIFMMLKAGFICAIFMHMVWERLALIYAILLPCIAILFLMVFMISESGYTLWTRMVYFMVGM